MRGVDLSGTLFCKPDEAISSGAINAAAVAPCKVGAVSCSVQSWWQRAKLVRAKLAFPGHQQRKCEDACVCVRVSAYVCVACSRRYEVVEEDVVLSGSRVHISYGLRRGGVITKEANLASDQRRR